ncbi:uncharacterized protein LOC107619581 isoform X2 [Arachis ipaensis]|uniref:uncharacterized protein LOC107619581 isoform X2 n=1 Tax=Arachis ipaensis TaxID=130454 RepID=UPI000A2B716F|nr:uncharacterized protein LOC107619581 isoform X2 [Arachis ipaensis]
MEAVAQKLEQPLMVNDYHRKEVVFGDAKAISQFTINTNLITTAVDEVDAASATNYNTNEFGPILIHQKGTYHHQQHEEKNWLPISDSSSSSHEVNPQKVLEEEEPIGVVVSTTEKIREIYLKKIYIMPPNHEFYCPKCNVCIEKVVLCKTGKETDSPQFTQQQEPPVICSACFGFLIQKGREWFSGFLPISAPAPGPTPTPTPKPNVPRETEEGEIIATKSSNKGWEVLKSFVYGGLAELLASLSLVTSSASADANTLNIVALAIANLIGGLVLLIHNLRDLKNTKAREEETENEAGVDKYYELLGRRDNFYLHTFVAVLSFLIFGLLPPVVYGFSFRESDDKELKLAAVAVASLIGLTLLALGKAHTQRRPNSNSYVIYFTTVLYYVTSGVLASLLTYVAGALVKRLVEQLGWFDTHPTLNDGFANAMSFPIGKNQGMSYY